MARLNNTIRKELIRNVMEDYISPVDDVKKDIAVFAEDMRQKYIDYMIAKSEFNALADLEAAMHKCNEMVIPLYGCDLISGGGGYHIQTTNHVSVACAGSIGRIRLTFEGHAVGRQEFHSSGIDNPAERRVGIARPAGYPDDDQLYKFASTLRDRYEAAKEERAEYHLNLTTLIGSFRTTEQLIKALPEFEKYIPEKVTTMLPAVDKAAILSKLKKG